MEPRKEKPLESSITPNDQGFVAVLEPDPHAPSHMKGVAGGKLNVPVPDVSCVDLVCTLPREVSPWALNEVFRSASGSTMKGILDFTEMPIVSTDVRGSPASCTFDSLATLAVEGTLVKTLGWYDQGGGLAHRIVELIHALCPGKVAS